MHDQITRILFYASFFVASACGGDANLDVANRTYKLDGKIDDFTANEVIELKSNIDVISIDSPGGLITASVEIGKLLKGGNIRLEIRGRCSSACSEYILPTQNSVKVSQDTLIGFHGNALIRERLLHDAAVEIPENCTWPSRDWLRYLYGDMGISDDFLDAQNTRLKILNFQYHENSSGCINSKVLYEHLFWFPTAKQIKQYLNIDIIGQLCSDNPSCINKTSKLNARGGTCVFGDIIENC